ncbi:M23 family metallopeptidase [Metabacillus sp. GX 13764]|uniref:M23 family metallopeptidase n=1 Tax=Metabacillus kandeliae TaxID=2900151 RepID=UPI001E51C15F|nr:M23 family metallopeptidase [Metabacillus kandeliae]MCD7034304.1 M23 family metallopeptidase [Metabacillus kandeliae]
MSNFRVSTAFAANDTLHPDGHKGIDLAGKKGPGSAMGMNIPAVAGGKVVQVFNGNKTAGNGVVIRGTDGRDYRYIHMKNPPNLKVGQTIQAGQSLGNVGSTGRSTGAHLDLKILENGKYIDPYKFLQGLSGGSSSSPKKAPAGKINNLYGETPKSSYTNTYKTRKEATKAPGYQTYKGALSSALQTGKVPSSWIVPLTELIGRESTWDANVKNSKSSAYGYGQLLKDNQIKYSKITGYKYSPSDPVGQIINTVAYIKDRYGTPEKALAFWDKHKYY